MARKRGGTEGGPPGPGSGSPARRQGSVSRRTIKRNKETSQLLERGEGPTAEEQIDPAVDSPSEITIEGGPGTDAAYSMGGPLADARKLPNQRSKGTGGEGGHSTLGGGVYPDEGQSEDAPRYGDWPKHSSSARGRRRPDQNLARELREILTKDPELNATDITVEVEGGAVRLGGVVDSLDAKLLAEELVESVTGVREVHNELRVAREE
jgi:hypothetical protein